MPRLPFNNTCDIFKGPGTATPGQYVGTFPCRFVVEDGIHALGPGCPTVPAYLTILGYQPQGAWTSPFFGMDATLCDRIAIPSGQAPRFWVLYTDAIIWLAQPAYYRAYLVYLPAPTPGPAGGIVWGGSASVSGVHDFVGEGGIVWGGSAGISTIRLITGSGGILWGGSANKYFSSLFVGSGGILWGGDADSSVTHMRSITGSGGILWGGDASHSFTSAVVGSGGILWGGSATITFTPGITVYWYDTFTDTNGVNVPPHTGETTPGGYTSDFNQGQIQSNALVNAVTSYGIRFDPAATAWTYTANFKFDANSTGLFFMFRRNAGMQEWWVSIFPSAGSATGFNLVCNGGTPFTGVGTLAMTAGTTYTVTIVVTSTTVSATIGAVNVTTTNSSWNTATRMGFQMFAGATLANTVFDVRVTS